MRLLCIQQGYQITQSLIMQLLRTQQGYRITQSWNDLLRIQKGTGYYMLAILGYVFVLWFRGRYSWPLLEILNSA